MLDGHNISVNAGNATLLRGVSIEVRPGSIIAILGPNGAGKSTLLRALGGEIVPSEGTVTMNGRRIADWPAMERARYRGMLPQQSSLSFPFTALEVVRMGRLPWAASSSHAWDDEVAFAALALVDVTHLAYRCYTTLSGGERQRVHLARVLAQVWEGRGEEGCYLLFDEPVAGLDLNHQHDTLAIARRFADKGFGVAVVLHDLNLAAQYADTIALLRNGSIVRSGTPQEVLIPPLLEDMFNMPISVLPHPLLPIPLVFAGGNGSAWSQLQPKIQ